MSLTLEFKTKILEEEDELLLRALFASLDEKTAEYYGRFDDLINNAKEIAHKIVTDRYEIGVLMTTNGVPIGYAHLYLSQKESRKHSAGFGIVITPRFQGVGLGKKLIKEVFNLARYWSVKKIWLHVYDFNERAFKLYKKMGFKKVGVFEKEEFKMGKYRDIIVMEKWV